MQRSGVSWEQSGCSFWCHTFSGTRCNWVSLSAVFSPSCTPPAMRRSMLYLRELLLSVCTNWWPCYLKIVGVEFSLVFPFPLLAAHLQSVTSSCQCFPVSASLKLHLLSTSAPTLFHRLSLCLLHFCNPNWSRGSSSSLLSLTWCTRPPGWSLQSVNPVAAELFNSLGESNLWRLVSPSVTGL